MLKVAHINQERIIAEQELKDFVRKLREKDRQKAHKMLMQQGLKKKPAS